MKLIVQKYGGSSLSSVAKLRNVAKKVYGSYYNSGTKLVIVLSAMGSSTDKLVELSSKAVKDVNKRDYDMLVSSGEQVSIAMLSMLINDLGGRAIPLTGWQAGIKTDSSHTNARIESISTRRIKAELRKNNTVVVAGFQGITNEDNIKLKIEKGQDIFERGHNLKKVKIDSSFPKYILQNKDKLKKWIV